MDRIIERTAVEAKIVRELLNCLTKSFQVVSAVEHDKLHPKTTDVDQAFSAIFPAESDGTVFPVADEVVIYVYQEGKRYGHVLLVFGNDGYDVIADYTTCLESVLRPAAECAEKLANLQKYC